MYTQIASIQAAVILIVITMLAVPSGSVDSADAVFRKVSGDGFGTDVLGPVFSASNLLKCAARCLIRYLHDCKSIIYDKPNHLCIPGGPIYTTLTPRSPGDLYSTNTDCRNTEGLIVTLFELLVFGQSGTCQNINVK